MSCEGFFRKQLLQPQSALTVHTCMCKPYTDGILSCIVSLVAACAYLVNGQLYGADVIGPNSSAGEVAMLPSAGQNGPLIEGKQPGHLLCCPRGNGQKLTCEGGREGGREEGGREEGGRGREGGRERERGRGREGSQLQSLEKPDAV